MADAIPRFGDKRSDIERFHDHAAHGKVLDGMQIAGSEKVGVREDVLRVKPRRLLDNESSATRSSD